MRAISTNGSDRRRGVALIVVLGFLSIMVMMAVAFLTQARVERLVAGASLEGMRTRQMAQSAIAAGMQDYLNALKGTSQTDTKHDVFLSGNEPGTMGDYYYSKLEIGDDRLALGKVEDWLLEHHLNAALSGGGDAVRNAEWLWVRERPGERSRILGRYAYACFDMSGQIDANLLGTAFGDSVPSEYNNGGDSTNRNNVRKMLFDAVKSVPDAGNARQSALNKHQRIWKGFDTPAALLNLTDGDWNDGRNSGPNRWLGTDMDEEDKIDVSDLSCYSYSATHLGTREDGSLKVRCDANDIDDIWPIDSPEFVNILDGASKGKVIYALQDYENSRDLNPIGTDYPSVKDMPMFNEIGVKLELDNPGGGANYELVMKIKMEFWYPFPSNKRGNNFTVELPTTLGIGTASEGPLGVGIWIRARGGTNAAVPEIELQGGGNITPTPSDLSVIADFNDGDPYVAGDEIVYRIPLSSPSGPLPAGMYLFTRSVRFQERLVLKDGVEWDATPREPIGVVTEGIFLSGPRPNGAYASIAVNDPRLNCDQDAWMPEIPSDGSFGEINGVASAAIGDAETATGLKPGKYMYCRNDKMKSPAELGYISNGKAWQTLDIFCDEGTWLMNRLVSDSKVYGVLSTNKVFFTNGTINPYTRNTNVLNAAFYGVSLAEVPDMPSGVDGVDYKLTRSTELADLVKEMSKDVTKKGHAGWSSILNDGKLNPDWNKNNRIALVNNTWGLFDESDRLFVIAVVAQSIKESSNKDEIGNWNDGSDNKEADMITGERRAVALCWMDGSTEGSANTLAQELNIIAFQYLND